VLEAVLDHVLNTAARCLLDLVIVRGDVDEYLRRRPSTVDRRLEPRFINVAERRLERLVHGPKGATVGLPASKVGDESLVGPLDVFEQPLRFRVEVHV
jgi:hypothetical protein